MPVTPAEREKFLAAHHATAYRPLKEQNVSGWSWLLLSFLGASECRDSRRHHDRPFVPSGPPSRVEPAVGRDETSRPMICAGTQGYAAVYPSPRDQPIQMVPWGDEARASAPYRYLPHRLCVLAACTAP